MFTSHCCEYWLQSLKNSLTCIHQEPQNSISRNMGIDQTMLAPGPAGTSMIGERSIEAAARRGLEKRRRRKQELKLANEDPSKDRDTMSKTTLMALPSSTSTSNETPAENADGALSRGTVRAPYESQKTQSFSPSSRDTPINRDQTQKRESGIRGKWERIQRRFRGVELRPILSP
jgi:hypothetical protein